MGANRGCVGLTVGILVAVLAVAAVAQELALGRIKGTIRDTSGAVIAGATVVLRHEATGVETKTLSNNAGDYAFESLPIGSYTLTLGTSGFRTAIRTGVRVISGETTTMDVDLTVGATTQTIQVTAETSVLNTTENTVGTTRLSEEVSQLPFALSGQRGRDAIGSALTTSGVKYDPTGDQSKEGYTVSRASIDGAPQSQVGYYLDGVAASTQGHELGEEFTYPVPETVAEFRIMNNDSAEYGWNSGVGLSLTLKSGTNQLHGTAYEYLRNNAVDSRNFFAPKVSVNKQNEFGFVLGGPVVVPKVYNGKDRTFFFFNYDGFRFRTTAGGTVNSVPTVKMRGGDFSELLGAQTGTDELGRPVYSGEIYDPSTTRQQPDGSFIRDPFMYNGQLNVMGPNQFSSVSQFFMNSYPLPTRSGTQSNQVVATLPVVTDIDNITGKIDEVLSSTQRITFGFGNVLRERDLNQGDNGLGGILTSGNTNIESEYRYRLNYNWSVRPTLLLSVTAGVQRTPGRDITREPYPAWTGGAQAGLKGVVTPDTPSVSITGLTSFGSSFRQLLIKDQGQSAEVNLSWTKGAHDFKFGAQTEYITPSGVQTFSGGTAGTFSFVPQETGLPGYNATGSGAASFLLGAVDKGTVSNPEVYHLTQGAWGFYAQDQWRLTRKLTLNYGLRWDLFVPTHGYGNYLASFDPTVANPGAGGRLGALTFWGQGPGRNGLTLGYNYYYKAFGPRIGFAYLLNSKTVIRAHYGITYPPHFGDFTSGENFPMYGDQAVLVKQSLDNGVTPGFLWDNGFPLSFPTFPITNPSYLNNGAVNYVNRADAAKPGRSQNINFGIERELPGKMALRLDYVGNLSHGLPTSSLIWPNQMPTSDLSLGNLLLASISSPQAQAAGIPLPYPGFTGTVAQALRPYPQYTDIKQLSSPSGYILYHSLQMNLQKRVGQGLTFLVAYTISKSLDNGDFGNQGWMSTTRIQANSMLSSAKKLTNLDQPQTLAISYMYELPFGPGKQFVKSTNPVIKQLVGGWQVAGVQNYFSGNPFSISTTAAVPGGFSNGIWANRVLGVPIPTANGCANLDPNDPNRKQYLNINAFATPQAFNFGNTKVQPNVRACGYLGESIAAIKNFRISDKARVEFGAYFFNAFNRKNWYGLQTNIGVPASFGTYTAATVPRQIQFYSKLSF